MFRQRKRVKPLLHHFNVSHNAWWMSGDQTSIHGPLKPADKRTRPVLIPRLLYGRAGNAGAFVRRRNGLQWISHRPKLFEMVMILERVKEGKTRLLPPLTSTAKTGTRRRRNET